MAIRIRVCSIDYRHRVEFVITDETDGSRSVAETINPLTFKDIGDDIIRTPTGYMDRLGAQELADNLAVEGFYASAMTKEMKRLQDDNTFLRGLLEKVVK